MVHSGWRVQQAESGANTKETDEQEPECGLLEQPHNKIYSEAQMKGAKHQQTKHINYHVNKFLMLYENCKVSNTVVVCITTS